jgi:type IV pilus assembly protein PilC
MRKHGVYDDEILSLFMTQLALIYESGMDLRDGLSFLINDKKFKIDQLKLDLKKSGKLSLAMEKDGHFPLEAVLAIKAAEMIGQEGAVSSHLAHFYQRQNESKAFLKEIMFMPMMLMSILILVMAVLSFVVIPVFQEVYASLGGSLDAWIEILLLISEGIVIVALVLLSFALIWLIIQSLKSFFTQKSLDLADKILSLFPQRKAKADLARFSFMTQLVLKAGLNQREALNLAISQISEGPLKTKLESLSKELKPSQGLYDLLLSASLYPPLLQNTLNIAHKTGKTDEVLEHLSQKTLEDSENSLMVTLNRFEPILILTLSGFVALVLFSLIIPLIGIMSSLS